MNWCSLRSEWHLLSVPTPVFTYTAWTPARDVCNRITFRSPRPQLSRILNDVIQARIFRVEVTWIYPLVSELIIHSQTSSSHNGIRKQTSLYLNVIVESNTCFIYTALLLSNYFVEYNKHTNWIYINYATYPTHTTLYCISR